MRYAVWYIILIFSTGNNFAQNFPNIQFSHLAEKEGLSNNQVNSIAQDREGFIWIGTSDGLNRFDGYRLRSFHQIPGEKNSLIFNGVYKLVCDKKDGIWISTSEGLSYYNKRAGRFYNFRHNPDDSNSIVNDKYTNVLLADDHGAWITNTTNLYKFDSLLNYSRFEPGFSIREDQKEENSYSMLAWDRQGELWGATSNFLFLLDKKTLRVKKRYEDFNGVIRAIYQDSKMRFWIGSFLGGLALFDPVNNSFQQIPLQNKSRVINSITEWKDKNGYSWIVAGTDGGLVLIDPVTFKSRAYQNQTGYRQDYLLTSDYIACVFVDKQNILWIGTNNGVSYVRPSQQQFEPLEIHSREEAPNEKVEDYVYSFDENSKGLWFSTWLKKGIYLYNHAGELPIKFSLAGKSGSGRSIPALDSIKPFYVFCQGDSLVWMTTENSLVRMDLQKAAVDFYNLSCENMPVGLRTIVPTGNHQWWIRTRNNGANGIYVFDPQSKKFIAHYSSDENSTGFAPAFITNIYMNRKRQIFLGSRNDGLFKYDSSTDSFTHLFQFSGDQLPDHSNEFEYITSDKTGLLWIATFKGLFVFDPESNKVVRDYSNDATIGGVDISALCFDNKENLWMNTSRGLFCLTASGKFKHFDSENGLPNNFTEGVLRMGDSSYMYCGLRTYLVRFNPVQLLNAASPTSEVHFSEATVMDKPYYFKSVSGEKTMELEAGQDRFAVDFSIMNYDDKNDEHYYYRLDGASNEWQQNDNGHLVFYNIAPGKYTLHVKGSDKQVLSPSEEDQVHINIKAFWWQTRTFWIACLAAGLLLTAFIIRRNIAAIRRQAAFRQRIAEMEMKALRAQMNPHFIFNSLNSIENFIMQNKERQASDYLNKFARLIRIILENNLHNLIPVTQDLEALQLYVDLEQFRFNNKFSYKFCIDKDLTEENYKVPPLLIQPFVENAIVHGLANSDRNDLYLTVEARLLGDFIEYIIEDNGVGRKNVAMYQVQNRKNHKSVGLQITQERISIFNQKQAADDDVMITDLYDETGNALGTRCQIKIKPM
ncbi:MAG: hypothetical protein C5B52_01475 [Bacteroidetes bacterium]|nr:MAG: hypothetical protein C5B52_01475 [Bacteroidota bacterium]